jgi:alpha-L-fucosidase
MAQEFIQLVRSIQPQCLVNGRVGNYSHELQGDYQNMNDNGMPAGGLDEYWETPQTLNTTWGYSKYDQDWKTPAGVIQRLVEIVSKGGNYLLNIGPMPDGSIPPPSLAVLEKVGAWMRAHGESIYSTSACPVQFPWGRCTVKDNKVYLHVFTWPADGVLRVSGFRNQVRGAYPLLSPARKLTPSREHGVVSIPLPAGVRNEHASVIVMETVGEPQANPPVLTQGSDQQMDFDYMTATTSGNVAKRFNRDGKFHISKWTGPQDVVTWRALISQAGDYSVKIRYAARQAWAGGKYEVSVGHQRVVATVQPTGDWYEYKDFEIGKVKVTKAGEYNVSIRPLAEQDHYLMYFQSLTIEPPHLMVD